MIFGEGTLYALIAACEAAFWVALFAGLAMRYVLRWRRASKLCLLCVPLIDVLLLALTVLDLRSGAKATLAHGLAMAYIGFTVAFGSSVIGWADHRFAHRYEGSPLPPEPAGWASVRCELRLWVRCLLAVAITCALLAAVTAFVGRPQQTRALAIWYGFAFGTASFWFLFGPLWSRVFFRREPAKPSDAGALGYTSSE